MSYKVLAFVGGISRGSLNQKVYSAIKDLTPQTQIDLESYDITRLPFFSQDLESDLPNAVKNLKEQIERANGILFITPEYNRSFPGVLKNALDWGSRPYGKNSWNEKPAAVFGASVGNIGTFGAQHHLRQVLSYLNTFTMGQPEVYLNASKAFDEKGSLVDMKVKEILQKFLQNFEKWIELHSKIK